MNTSRLVRSLIIIGAAVGLLGLLVLTRQKDTTASDRLAVSASFYPMAEFARQVGGDRVAVTTLVGPGIEPHDYDPTPQEMSSIYKAKLVVYNGANFEPWMERIKHDLESSGVALVATSAGIPLRPAAEGGHEDTAVDPHLWLDPQHAIRQVNAVKDGLISVDPDGVTVYEKNAAAYIAKLQALDKSYRTGLASCELRQIITSHEAFGYLAARFHFEAVSLAGPSPDDEPSPGELAAVAEYARAHGITHIFFETLASPKLAQTLASEVGAEALVFNPIEGLTDQERKDGKDYLKLQQENLHALRTALHCR